jgi:monoamine oxidase
MEDVIIVGAGVAGLAAAVELKRSGVSFRILEAGDGVGGRARTRILRSGIATDLGAHWLHGQDNPVTAELTRYGIGARPDQGDRLWIYSNGEARQEEAESWLQEAIRADLADAIMSGDHPDVPLPELGIDDHARQTLSTFSLLWNGVQPPVYPSAREFLTDESTPGGVQVDGGMCAFTSAMLAEAGADRVHLRTSVCRITETPDGITIQSMDGSVWTARRVIFTASLGVLQGRLVKFAPDLSRVFQEQIAGLVMGHVNKIIIEVDPVFMAATGVPEDMALELLDVPGPHFCHVRGAGQPIIQIYAGGREAEAIESLAPDQALDYARDILAPVEALKGFEAHVVSPPIVTRWVANPYTRGAYSCCLPGAHRTRPVTEGLVTFCGEAFDDRFPASVAGAWRSGKAAAEIVMAELAAAPVAEAVNA